MPVRGQPGGARAWTEARTGAFPPTPDLCLSVQPGLPACPPPSPFPASGARPLGQVPSCPSVWLSADPSPLTGAPEQGRLTTRLLHLPSHLGMSPHMGHCTWATAHVSLRGPSSTGHKGLPVGGNTFGLLLPVRGLPQKRGHGADEAGKDPASICHSLSHGRGADGGNQSAGGKAFRPILMPGWHRS